MKTEPEKKTKTHRWADIKNESLSDAQKASVRERVQLELLELTLRDLREQAGKTQAEVAALTEQTQAELSRFERREDHKLSTLRRYVEALGGELEVSAVFGNKKVTLQGV